MEEIRHWMPEFEQLLLKVASNPSSLIWIDEIRNFYEQFEGKDDYGSVRFECESLMSMIYRHSNSLEKSFDIDLRLLRENQPSVRGYWGVISQAVRTSEQLGRNSEIIPYALKFLNTPDDSFSKKWVVLLWYVTIFAQKENSYFESLKHVIRNAELFLDEKNELTYSFVERTKYLHDKYVRVLMASNSFEMAYSKANDEEKVQLKEAYLAAKPPKFFQDRYNLYY